jgi:hypothetical protein
MPKVHRTILPYDPMPRAIPLDAGLDFADVGIYAWARALPDGAEISVEEIVRQHRGVGMPRARASVIRLRERGLWHTITLRTSNPEAPLQSFVVVPPDPWSRQRAVDDVLSDPKIKGVPVDGPSDARLRRVLSADRPPRVRVSAGRPDRELADGLAADGLPPDRLPPDGHSLEREVPKNYPPNPPAERGGERCPDHRRPARGCCTDRDRRRRAVEAEAARAEATRRARRARRWCGVCDGPDTRRELDTGQPCSICSTEGVTA